MAKSRSELLGLLELTVSRLDFQAIHSYMSSRTTPTGRPKPWTWARCSGVPLIAELRREVFRLGEMAVDHHLANPWKAGNCASGGFEVHVDGGCRVLFDGREWPINAPAPEPLRREGDI